MPIGMIGAGLAIASGVMGKMSADSAAKDAKQLIKRKLWQHDMDSAYNLNQMEKSNKQQMSLVDAVIGSSNIQFKGSVMSYRKAQQTELDQQLRHARKTAEIQREVVELGGDAQVSSLKKQGQASLLGGVTNAYGALYG